jgi:hypothetical protein
MFYFSLFHGLSLALSLIFQADNEVANSFDDLGSLLLWGILGAIFVAAVVAYILIKVRSRQEEAFNHSSIAPPKDGVSSR